MNKTMQSVMVVAALLAAPALAQAQAQTPQGASGQKRAPELRAARMQRGPMFGNVSPEGRQILRDAWQSVTREDRQAVRAARDRINDVVAADRLDVAALQTAMAQERKLVDANHAKRQDALVAAMPKLSAEDRRAFAEDARRGRAKMEQRADNWRQRTEARRQRSNNMPPPPAS